MGEDLVNDFGGKFIENRYISSSLCPRLFMKDLIDELLMVTKAAVARMLHNESVKSGEHTVTGHPFSQPDQLRFRVKTHLEERN
jgi:hypothetical protein